MNERLRHIEDETLTAKGVELYEGWNDKIAKALVQKSLEALMLQNVPKDHSRRFTDEAAAQTWWQSAPGRLFYPLLKDNDLAGVVWYTPEPDTESTAEHTFAIRLYECARGASISMPFMQASYNDAARHGVTNGVWLETDTTNRAARYLYSRFGYQTTAERDDGRVHMVYGINENK